MDIDKIIVGDRIRKDFGNIEELAEDIRTNGLINPPTINKEYRLLAGERRLRACKSLGWTQIEVHMLDTKDEAHDLSVEMSENNMRRNFTGSELAEGIRRQMAIESEKAKVRMQDPMQTFAEGQTGTSRDKAAEQFGISGEQVRKTLFVDDHRDLLDPTDFANWDEGKLSTNKAYQRIKAAQKQAEDAKAQAEREKALAERERDNVRQNLADAYRRNEVLESENARLKSQPKPQPEIVEREVVREVVPSDYEETKRSNERMRTEIQNISSSLRDQQTQNIRLRSQIDQMEKQSRSDAQRDIEQLTMVTNTYLRQCAADALAFDQFDRVDSATQDALEKAITNLCGFAQNMMQMIKDRK